MLQNVVIYIHTYVLLPKKNISYYIYLYFIDKLYKNIKNTLMKILLLSNLYLNCFKTEKNPSKNYINKSFLIILKK